MDEMTWGQKGKDIAKQLEGLSDEESIKTIGLDGIRAIYEQEGISEERKKALSMMNREILKVFPRQKEKTDCYYHDPNGKAELPKWRHLIFKYLTLEAIDWDVVGGEAKETWKTQQVEEAKPIEQPEVITPTEQAKTAQQPKKPRTRKPKQILKTMTIEQLNLDSETQQTLEEALNHSGMALEDFIKQAIKVYARTIKGKAEQRSMDLANVSTEELLNDSKWKTQPGRAEELTKRAIAAIVKYNTEVATENADRWKITQSAIASLTGSRPQAVGEILKQYQTTIDDHNNKPEYAFTDYSNRKPGKKITDVINLAQLIPNGID